MESIWLSYTDNHLFTDTALKAVDSDTLCILKDNSVNGAVKYVIVGANKTRVIIRTPDSKETQVVTDKKFTEISEYILEQKKNPNAKRETISNHVWLIYNGKRPTFVPSGNISAYVVSPGAVVKNCMFTDCKVTGFEITMS